MYKLGETRYNHSTKFELSLFYVLALYRFQRDGDFFAFIFVKAYKI